MPEGLNYYDILQVSPHATPDVIKAAHRALSKMMHPDAGGSNDLAVAINEALDVLSEPAQRTRYDLELRIGKAKTFAPRVEIREQVLEVLIVVCLACGARNRVRDLAAIAKAKCGTCGRVFQDMKADTPEPSGRERPSSSQSSKHVIARLGRAEKMVIIGAWGLVVGIAIAFTR